jgi:hypothetical protein
MTLNLNLVRRRASSSVLGCWDDYLKIVSISLRVFFVVVLPACASINVETRTEVIYLHTSNPSCLIVEYIHVVSALGWFPLYYWFRFAHCHELEKESWRGVFSMTARAIEAV